MKAEVGNLRIAWRYWLAQSDLGRMGQLAGSLLTLNEARGWYQDTVELATDMLAVLAPDVGDARVCRQGDRAPADARAGAHRDPRLHARGRRRVRAGTRAVRAGRELRAASTIRSCAASRTCTCSAPSSTRPPRSATRSSLSPRPRATRGCRSTGTSSSARRWRSPAGCAMGSTHLDTAIALFKADPGRAAGVTRRQRSARRVPHDVGVLPVDARASRIGRSQRADAAIALSDQLGHPYTSAYARFHSGFLHLWRREPELVLDRAIRLREIADEYDFRVWSAIASCLLGAAQTGLGQLEEGLARSREGMAAYQRDRGAAGVRADAPVHGRRARAAGRAVRRRRLPLIDLRDRAGRWRRFAGDDGARDVVLHGDLLRDAGATEARGRRMEPGPRRGAPDRGADAGAAGADQARRGGR